MYQHERVEVLTVTTPCLRKMRTNDTNPRADRAWADRG